METLVALMGKWASVLSSARSREGLNVANNCEDKSANLLLADCLSKWNKSMVNLLIYGITRIIKTNFGPVTLEEKKTTRPIADLLRVGDLVPSCRSMPGFGS